MAEPGRLAWQRSHLPPSSCLRPTRAGRTATGRHRIPRVRARLGGFAQLLAGMWEFRRGNVFASTAFSSYGASGSACSSGFGWRPLTGHDLGWILLAFAIFNTYMLLMATR